jgi:hypothetical protein
MQEIGRRDFMLRVILAIGICLVAFPAFCQSKSNYEVCTIIEVKPHQAAAHDGFDVASYDVSAKVGDTIYTVLYTPPLGESTPLYAAGRELLVAVGKNTITYNDILGRSFEVPIESQKPAVKPKQSK